jgi:cephalosporin hydroxylase
MDPIEEFQTECANRIKSYASNKDFLKVAHDFMIESTPAKYSYNFTWLGRPIIQYPQDIVALQEIIWRVKPDLVIETGIAHGGSLIFSASIMELLDICENSKSGSENARRMVLGIDIDIRDHNRLEIERHPLNKRINMIQGSSVEGGILRQVYEFAQGYKTILVFLDSNHTHEHVLAELKAYAPLVSVGSYCIVFDTIINDLPEGIYPDRPWNKKNNPKTAMREFLSTLDSKTEGKQKDAAYRLMDRNGQPMRFVIDTVIDNKLLISVSPNGYLRRI